MRSTLVGQAVEHLAIVRLGEARDDGNAERFRRPRGVDTERGQYSTSIEQGAHGDILKTGRGALGPSPRFLALLIIFHSSDSHCRF